MTDEEKPTPDGEGNAGKSDDKDDKPILISYTQEQLDAMFSERAKKAASSRETALFEKAGVKSEEELVAIVAENKKAKEANQTEVEKLKADKEAAEQKAAKAETDRLAALDLANECLMKSEVIAEAISQGFRPEAIQDVWLIIDKSLITEKDGTFTGVKEAVEAVAKAKPFLMADSKEKTGGKGTPKQGETNKKTNGDANKPAPVTPKVRL